MAGAGALAGRAVGQWLARTQTGDESSFACLEANLAQVAGPHRARALAIEGYASYGRYWAELLRLPTLTDTVIDDHFTHRGRHHLVDTRAAGHGPILVLPHLGGWEWAAAWLTRIDRVPVAAVAEAIEPPDVFDWFEEHRQAYGIEVIKLGPDAFSRLVAAVRRRDIVCLLGDRVIDGAGIEVDFFGRPAHFPSGPALLSRRTGAPIHLVATYFRPDGGHHCDVGPPLWPDTEQPLRSFVADTTQAIATGFEACIAEAPEQWHVLSPIWSSGERRTGPSHDE